MSGVYVFLLIEPLFKAFQIKFLLFFLEVKHEFFFPPPQTNIDFGDSEVSGSGYNEEKPTTLSKQEQAKEYNLGVLKNIQAIFAHLAESKLQYYVPRGFWKHFK